MRTLLTILILSALTCKGQNTTTDVKNSQTFKSFYSAIRHQFILIDSLREANYDSVEAANDKLVQIIKSYKAAIFNFPDTLDYDLIYLAKSSDKKLALLSWDTRTGGTLIAFTTMAIFKTPQAIRTKMLADTTNETTPYTYMHYNSIHTITTADAKNIYLAWGNGQGSTALPWQELRTFSITENQLTEPEIFPDKTSSVYVEFDLHAFKDDQKVPVIRIKNSGKTFQVPIEGERQGFSGKYKTYIFNEKVFTAK